jgi:hypothetical protein
LGPFIFSNWASGCLLGVLTSTRRGLSLIRFPKTQPSFPKGFLGLSASTRKRMVSDDVPPLLLMDLLHLKLDYSWRIQ